MTTLLEKAFETVRSLPQRDQDEIALAMLALAEGDGEAEPIDPVDLAAVLEGLTQAKQGNLAEAEQVEAAFRRFDP